MKIILIFLAILLIPVLGILDVTGRLEDFKHEKIKAGQAWVEDLSDNRDPFAEKVTHTNVVLDVKDRYVLYIRYKPGSGNIFKRSSSEWFFAKRSKLLPFKLIPTESVITNFYRYQDLNSISTNVESTITWELEK